MRTRANGFGTRNRSHDWSRHARSAAAWSGTTTAPPFCAASNAPPLNFRRGPRGPSGVNATAEPAWSALTAPTRARTPPRVLEPSAARYPIRRGDAGRDWAAGAPPPTVGAPPPAAAPAPPAGGRQGPRRGGGRWGGPGGDPRGAPPPPPRGAPAAQP